MFIIVAEEKRRNSSRGQLSPTEIKKPFALSEVYT
jgi:hypothetical protein